MKILTLAYGEDWGDDTLDVYKFVIFLKTMM